MKVRFRLLPVLIFCAAFTLSLKLGGLWQGFDGLVSSSSAVAEEKVNPKDGKGAGKGMGKDAGKNAGKDVAEKSEKQAKPDDKAGVKESKSKPSSVGLKPNTARFDPRLVTDSELDVLQKLADRRMELNRRARLLDTRENLLKATENRIGGKIAELKKIQHTISNLLVKHDKEKEAQMRSVVKIYEKMKPKDAARILEELEMPILLDVIERMREAKTAPILAKMSARKAKSLTAGLAHRRALPKLDKKAVN